ncbi:evasin P1104-like isoform X2 [Dermacentor variabilis]|uniref:evasin P1104-like isoform X2 n=1 Tax=Dermacentor variabilis TaxID=34621 RepID=UPI003F5C76F7
MTFKYTDAFRNMCVCRSAVQSREDDNLQVQECQATCEASENGTCAGGCICVWVKDAERGTCLDFGDSVI